MNLDFVIENIEIFIAIIGILIGMISNKNRFFGNGFLNFALVALLTGINELLYLIWQISFPPWFTIFSTAYFVGTFVPKVIVMLPLYIPVMSDVAAVFAGPD